MDHPAPAPIPAISTDPTAWAEPYAAARAQKRWLAAYGDFSESEHPADWTTVKVDGALPPELGGVLRRILAGQHEIGGLRYHHWWDGDGALAEFRIADGKLDYRARYIETTKRARERDAGRAIYEQFATAMPGLIRPADFDDMNPANVAILDHAGELLALGDWCSAWRIERETLLGLGRKEWSADTAGAPFSAHPKIDAQGHLWSIGYEPWRGRLYLYHVGPDGALRNSARLDIPGLGFVHDFITTERHLVIPLTSTRWSRELEAAGKSLMDCLEYVPDQPIRVLIVDKSNLSITATYEMPPGMIYHCSNGYALENNDIRFHCCYFADPDYMFGTFRQVMRGELAMGAPPMQAVVTLTVRGETRIDMRELIGELPRVDERRVGQPFRQVWLGTPGEMRGPPDKFGFSALTRLDLETGAEDSYFFGHDIIAEEPAFAPRPGSTAEGDGWMVGTFFDIAAQRTSLAVFDAMRMADGPVAVAHLPHALPIGVHGNFHAA